MTREEGLQLSLEVGGDEPEAASFRISGSLAVATELQKGAPVAVHIAGADGEVVAAGVGYVSQVAFKEHRPTKGPAWTERVHTVRLES